MVSNPAWTNAVRDEHAIDLGLPLGCGGAAWGLEQFYHPQNGNYLCEFFDDTARAKFGKSFRFTAGKIGLDTDSEALVYVQVIDGVGVQTLEFYRGAARDNTAGNELVASTGAVADSTANRVIVPGVGYTLAGLVDTTIGATFNFTMHLEPPPVVRIGQQFTGSNAYDRQLSERGVAAIRAMRSAFSTARVAAQAWAQDVLNVEIMPTIPVRTGSQLLNEGITVLDGDHTVNPTGALPDLAGAQQGNLTGAGEVFAGAGAYSGSCAFAVGGWQGKQSAAPTYSQRARGCTITFRINRKLGSDPPDFVAERSLTDTRLRPNEGLSLETLSRPLRIGAVWAAPEWGITALTVHYKAAISNITSALLSAAHTDWSVDGMTATNSSAGVFYAKWAAGILSFYRTAAGRTASDPEDVVATAALSAASVNSVFTAKGATGISIVGKTGAGVAALLVTNSTGDVDFQIPTVAAGSYFTLAISEDTAPSEWVKLMRAGQIGGAPFAPNVTEGVEVANLLDSSIRAGHPMINVGVNGTVY